MQQSTGSTQDAIAALRDNIASAVLGKPKAIQLSIVALAAGGHILIEDAPGLGKTALAKSIARSLGCEFTRIQCTPDLLPSDILGASVFLPSTGEFEFRRGPVFTNILLADEINRTTPRTQSAMLEAMSEFQVTVEGATYDLERPFFVIATQNPFEFEGTYPLPENQLDRFMLRIEVGYPDRAIEKQVLKNHRSGEPVEKLEPVVNIDQVRAIQQAARDVRVDDAINDYILDIVEATRTSEELSLGISTRGALTLYRAAQGYALVDGRDFVVPDDIKELMIPVLAHRIVCRGLMREGQRQQAEMIIRRIADSVPVPS